MVDDPIVIADRLAALGYPTDGSPPPLSSDAGGSRRGLPPLGSQKQVLAALTRCISASAAGGSTMANADDAGIVLKLPPRSELLFTTVSQSCQ
jgi:hypothetical protein